MEKTQSTLPIINYYDYSSSAFNTICKIFAFTRKKRIKILGNTITK